MHFRHCHGTTTTRHARVCNAPTPHAQCAETTVRTPCWVQRRSERDVGRRPVTGGFRSSRQSQATFRGPLCWLQLLCLLTGAAVRSAGARKVASRHHEGAAGCAGERALRFGAMTSAAPAVQVVTETDIVLRDGSTVHVRPSTTEDVPRLRAFLASLSDESRWFRFFSAGVDLDAAARSAAAPDDGLALIVLRDGAVVGHGTYICGAAGGRRSPSRWRTPGTATGSPPCAAAHLAHRRVWSPVSTRSPRPSCRGTTGCCGCSTTPASRSPPAGPRERSRSSSRRRCRGTRGGA